jgi:hypothetical protein
MKKVRIAEASNFTKETTSMEKLKELQIILMENKLATKPPIKSKPISPITPYLGIIKKLAGIVTRNWITVI